MGSKLGRYRERGEALKRIHEIRADSKNAFVIHYSCESFYDTPDNRTARVTSIAIRNLNSAQTRSFSIHKIAEQQKIPVSDIPQHYDKLERKMLEEYSDFIRSNSGRTYVHWNMRDNNYGFAAIEHRFKVLGGDPEIIDEAYKFDLARATFSIYGSRYVNHGKEGRFLGICRLNRITNKDAMTGKEEAEAFPAGEYIKLHLSTLRKVDMMANVFERIEEGTLKTQSKFWDVYPIHPQVLIDLVRNHWAWSLIVMAAILAGLGAKFV